MRNFRYIHILNAKREFLYLFFNYLKQLCSLPLDRRVISRVHPSPEVSSPNPGRPRDGWTAEDDQSSTPDRQASSYHPLFVATTNLMPSRLPLP